MNILRKIKEWLLGTREKKDEENEQAFIKTRKVSKQGGSYYLNLPMEWFNKNDLDPEDVEEITMLANSDILIINPGREDEVKKKIGKKTYDTYKDEKPKED